MRPRDDGNPDEPNDLDDPNDPDDPNGPDDETLTTLTYPSIPYIILIMVST